MQYIFRISGDEMSGITKFNLNGFYYYHAAEEIVDKATLYTHTHDGLELYYFISGDAKFYIEGNEFDISSGDIFIIRNNETHFLKVMSNEKYERIVLNFPNYFLNSVDPDKKLMDVYYNRRLGFGNRINEKELRLDIKELLLQMEKEEYSDYQKTLNIRILLSYILFEVNEFYHQNNSRSNIHSEDLLSNIIHYINENLTSDLNLNNISDKFFVSKSYLNRIFKANTGFSVWEYILTKRLVLAKECISNGTKASIACEFAGFNDYSSFYRQFKKKFGYSPNHIRPEELTNEKNNEYQ